MRQIAYKYGGTKHGWFIFLTFYLPLLAYVIINGFCMYPLTPRFIQGCVFLICFYYIVYFLIKGNISGYLPLLIQASLLFMIVTSPAYENPFQNLMSSLYLWLIVTMCLLVSLEKNNSFFLLSHFPKYYVYVLWCLIVIRELFSIFGLIPSPPVYGVHYGLFGHDYITWGNPSRHHIAQCAVLLATCHLSLIEKAKNKKYKLVHFILAFLAVCYSFTSGIRIAFLSNICLFISYIYLQTSFREKMKWLRWFIATTTLIFLSLFYLAIDIDFKSTILKLPDSMQISQLLQQDNQIIFYLSSGRYDLWKQHLDIFLKHPLLGIGWPLTSTKISEMTSVGEIVGSSESGLTGIYARSGIFGGTLFILGFFFMPFLLILKRFKYRKIFPSEYFLAVNIVIQSFLCFVFNGLYISFNSSWISFHVLFILSISFLIKYMYLVNKRINASS